MAANHNSNGQLLSPSRPAASGPANLGITLPAELINALAERPGIAALTGEAGTGKTILLRRLCGELKAADHLVIGRYRAGLVSINGPTYGAGPHMPFGGVKNSGNGFREPGTEALDVYSEWKTVVVNHDPARV